MNYIKFCSCIDINKLHNILKEIQKNNDIILIFANTKFKDRALKRIQELKEHNLTNTLIISLDTPLTETLTNEKIPHFHIPLKIQTIVDRTKLWIYRGFVWHIILNLHFNIMHIDADATILKNPFDIIDLGQGVDINFTQGTNHPMRIHCLWKFVVKCGLFYVKSNERTIDFFRELINYIVKKKDDQVGLNCLLHDRHIAWTIDPKQTYRIKSRDAMIQCSRTPFYGETPTKLRVVVLPHHLVPRVRHETNTPYVVDYL